MSDGRDIVQNQNSYTVVRDSGTAPAGSPCLRHLPGIAEVNNASFWSFVICPAAFETKWVGESESPLQQTHYVFAPIFLLQEDRLAGGCSG